MSSSTSLDLRRADQPADYLERAREIAPMLAAASDEIEERRELPERIVEALIERGFFRMLLPRSLGGAELDPLTYVQVLEEIAKADPSTAWSLGQNSGCSMTAPYLDPAVAREIFEARMTGDHQIDRPLPAIVPSAVRAPALSTMIGVSPT